jgi:hypothetical protein
MTEKEYELYEAIISKNLFPSQIANWGQQERIAKAIKDFSKPLAEALIGIINHIESKEYPLTGGDEIAVNDARAALTAAGYLNDESND